MHLQSKILEIYLDSISLSNELLKDFKDNTKVPHQMEYSNEFLINIIHQFYVSYLKILTRVSASMKTPLVYCVILQQWSLVKVTPRSGRAKRDRLAASWLSKTSTTVTLSNNCASWCLEYKKCRILLIHFSKPNVFGKTCQSQQGPSLKIERITAVSNFKNT